MKKWLFSLCCFAVGLSVGVLHRGVVPARIPSVPLRYLLEGVEAGLAAAAFVISVCGLYADLRERSRERKRTRMTRETTAEEIREALKRSGVRWTDGPEGRA